MHSQPDTQIQDGMDASQDEPGVAMLEMPGSNGSPFLVKRDGLREELEGLLADRDEISYELGMVEKEIEARLSAIYKAHWPEVENIPEPAEPPKKVIRYGRIPGIPRKPVIPVEYSVLPEAIVCLIDGVKRKMMHRHLKAKYGITPEQYRGHFRLPPDYPMTAPGYSKSQSRAVSKAIDTGRLSPWGRHVSEMKSRKGH